MPALPTFQGLWNDTFGPATVEEEEDTTCYHRRADADRVCRGCGVQLDRRGEPVCVQSS